VDIFSSSIVTASILCVVVVVCFRTDILTNCPLAVVPAAFVLKGAYRFNGDVPLL
jgi:hypothetical protein